MEGSLYRLLSPGRFVRVQQSRHLSPSSGTDPSLRQETAGRRGGGGLDDGGRVAGHVIFSRWFSIGLRASPPPGDVRELPTPRLTALRWRAVGLGRAG